MAGDDPDARRHRGARRRDPDAPPGLGGLRPRRRTSPTRWSTARSARRASAPTSWRTPAAPRSRASTRASTPRRADRAAAVQPDVQDVHGPGGGDAVGRLPAPGDGPGDLRQLRQRAARLAGRRSRSASPRSARRSATRSRRATSSSARASSSRWRCSSSSSPGTDAEWFEHWNASADARGTSSSASRRRSCASTSTATGELAHYAKAAFDIEYEFPFGWQELEGIHNRTDFDLEPAPGVLRQEARVLRRGDEGAVPPLHRRDLGRLRPDAS